MKNFKKIISFVLVLLMVFSMSTMAFAEPEDETEELPDIILDGGEEGGSSMIGHFDPPTSRNKPCDDYKYLGYASFLDMVPDGLTPQDGNYKYLVMTYTGDITQLRFEFNRLLFNPDGTPKLDNQGQQEQEKAKIIWFNPEGQTNYFVTVDETPIPLVGDNTTIVIDLAKTVSENSEGGLGAPIDWYNSGIHMHCDEMVKHGDGKGFDITAAYLTTKLPSEEEETTEATTEVPTTEAETEVTTEAPTTEAETEVTTEVPTTEAETEVTTEVPTTEAETEVTTEAPTTEAETEVTTEVPTTEATTETIEDEFPDIILNGGEEGKSTMIGTFTPPTAKGEATNDYKHLGFVSFLDMVPDKTFDEGNYRYLVMKYTGDITQLRFEFNRILNVDTDEQEKEGPYWFNPEGQTYYFVTADGSEIPLIGNDTMIVIDLAKSVNPNSLDGSGFGVGIDWYNSGIHMHCDEMITHGDGKGIKISYACLTNTIPSEEDIPDVTLPEKEDKPAESTTAAAGGETSADGELQAIILNGDDSGKSSMMKNFKNDKKATFDDKGELLEPAYKYLGYVTFKELANKNYKYLVLTYTGDIRNLRTQFVHNAGLSDEEIDPAIYWFDAEQKIHFVTADGSDIPLVGNNTTVIIDIEKSGIDLDWYKSGMHLHVNDKADITFSYAALLTQLPKEGESLPTKDTNTNPGGKAPATGDTTPVKAVAVVCFFSLVVLGGAVVVRRKYTV